LRLVLAAAAALVLAPAASAAPWPVLHGDFRIGHYRVKADGSLRGAVSNMGEPDSRTRRGETCELRWRVYGTRMSFYNLGGSDPCGGATGRFGRAILVGRQWSTASRLGIGAPAAAVRERHPRAFPRPRTQWWWLVRRLTPAGMSGLEAKVHRGRVTAFRVTYPAGGV
jgi:hypothetical protein